MNNEFRMVAGSFAVHGFAFKRYLIAEFYLVDRGLRHRLPGFSSLDRPVVLTQGLRRFRCQWSHCGSCPTGPDSRGAGLVRSELIPIGHVAY